MTSHMHTHIHAHMHASIHVHMHAHTCMHPPTHTCTHPPHTHTRTHPRCTHSHMHPRTYAHAHARSQGTCRRRCARLPPPPLPPPTLLQISSACVVCHSYGTFLASRLVQLHLGRIHSLALLDPVCFCLFTGKTIHSFVYRTLLQVRQAGRGQGGGGGNYCRWGRQAGGGT